MSNIKNKISRKSFFIKSALAGTGLFIIKLFPFRIFRSEKKEGKVIVKINPLAVSRKKIGGTNV
ncbi:MAG: hypothetical protein IPJ03_04160 [Ignavibacteriales bacterium]|nr:hypothetical protein [Ignavibacteriales bacterium]